MVQRRSDYKGDRAVVTAKLPPAYFDKLNRYVDATGTTKLQFISELVMRELDATDIEALNRDQEPLPMTA